MENTSPEIIVDTPMASVIPEEVERTENTEMMEETASDAAPADIGLSDSTRHIYKGQNSRFLAWLMEQVPNMITEHLASFVRISVMEPLPAIKLFLEKVDISKPPLHFQQMKATVFTRFLKSLRGKGGVMPKRQACTGRRAALYHLYSEYQEVVSHALKNEFSKEVEILWDPNSIGEASSPQDGLQPADIPDPEPELPPYKHVASDNSEAAIKANITLNAKLVVWLLDHQPSLLTKELRTVLGITQESMIHTIKKFIAAGEKPPLHFQDLKPATFAEFLKTIRKRNGCIPKVQAYYRRRSALYQFFEMYDQKTTPEFDRELDLQLKAVKMVIITRNDDPNYDNEHPLSAKDQEFEGFDISHFPEIPEPTVSAPTDFSKVTFSHDIINAAIAASPRESYIDLNTSFIVWLLENKQMLLTNDITLSIWAKPTELVKTIMDFLRSADKAPINFQKLDAPTFFDFLNSLPMHNGSIPNLDLYASHQYALGQLYEEHGQTIGTEMDLEMSALYEDMKNVVHELLNPPRFVNISKWIQSNSEASESGANLKRTYSEMDQNQKLPSNDINHSSDSQNAADDSGIHVSQRRRSDGSTDATFKGTHYINHDACIANIQAFMSEVTDRFDRMIPEIVHIVSKQLLPDIVEQVSTRIEARLAAAGITVNATNSTRNTMELSEIDMLPS